MKYSIMIDIIDKYIDPTIPYTIRVIQSVYKGHTVCPRIEFTRGSKFFILIVRKNFRGITFFVKMFILLILLQLTLLFDNHLITV
jgi:hypothetical protein